MTKGGISIKHYVRTWRADHGYDDRELVRLGKACRAIRSYARHGAARRCDVLDVGCGVGPLRQFLAREDFRIVGMDLSPELVAVAGQNYDEGLVADATGRWPFDDASFDAVNLGALMEHVPDWHAPLNQANRVLREGGLLVISVPNLRYWKEIRRLLQARQPHWLMDMQHVHAYTPRFLRDLVVLHGFEVLSLEADRLNIPLPGGKSDWLCRRLAGWGSVMILSARLGRRTRVEDCSRTEQFPRYKPVALRSIEVG
jgi:SAM-dependent methyltransferase